KMRVWLKDELSKHKVVQSMVSDAPRIRDATWVTPRLVAQVAFTEWTSDNRLRHPSFLGLREDKAPAEEVKQEPVALEKVSKARSRVGSQSGPVTVTLSHPERLLYPRDKITKEELAEYYVAMA